MSDRIRLGRGEVSIATALRSRRGSIRGEFFRHDPLEMEALGFA
jgi:hypothetical protein